MRLDSVERIHADVLHDTSLGRVDGQWRALASKGIRENLPRPFRHLNNRLGLSCRTWAVLGTEA